MQQNSDRSLLLPSSVMTAVDQALMLTLFIAVDQATTHGSPRHHLVGIQILFLPRGGVVRYAGSDGGAVVPRSSNCSAVPRAPDPPTTSDGGGAAIPARTALPHGLSRRRSRWPFPILKAAAAALPPFWRRHPLPPTGWRHSVPSTAAADGLHLLPCRLMIHRGRSGWWRVVASPSSLQRRPRPPLQRRGSIGEEADGGAWWLPRPPPGDVVVLHSGEAATVPHSHNSGASLGSPAAAPSMAPGGSGPWQQCPFPPPGGGRDSRRFLS